MNEHSYRQTTSRSLASTPTGEAPPQLPYRAAGFFPTLKQLLRDEGVSSLFAGLGPSLVLVINPILQYTLFEQLKNLLIRRRLAALPMKMTANNLTDRPPVLGLSDLDYFFLGAISKLCTLCVGEWTLC
jgi:adenine nucleotide transporter 17